MTKRHLPFLLLACTTLAFAAGPAAAKGPTLSGDGNFEWDTSGSAADLPAPPKSAPPAYPGAQADLDRPIVLGTVPNPSKPAREDKIWNWSKSQELRDLPAPHANGGLSNFSANIGSHLKNAPRRPNALKPK